jgi:hypothetical protein
MTGQLLNRQSATGVLRSAINDLARTYGVAPLGYEQRPFREIAL